MRAIYKIVILWLKVSILSLERKKKVEIRVHECSLLGGLRLNLAFLWSIFIIV